MREKGGGRISRKFGRRGPRCSWYLLQLFPPLTYQISLPNNLIHGVRGCLNGLSAGEFHVSGKKFH